MAEIDYYKILGVPNDATTSQIRSRYKDLALKLHPDHEGDVNLMALINEAYATLSDVQKRAAYDNKSKGGNNSYSYAKSSSSSHRSYDYQRRGTQGQQQQTHKTDNTSYQSSGAKQSYSQPKSESAKKPPTDQEAEREKERRHRPSNLHFILKYPYVLPGIFGLCTVGAGWSSPYVNRTHWIVGTAVGVGVFSYLYQRLGVFAVQKAKKRKEKWASMAINKDDERAGIIGTVAATIVLLGFVVLSAYSGPVKAITSSSNITPAQAVIDSKNQYYAPTNAASFTAADETEVATSCMSLRGISSYAYSTKVRYCGCSLGSIEQNYTPTEISEANANGNFTELETQSQNTINQYCSSLL